MIATIFFLVILFRPLYISQYFREVLEKRLEVAYWRQSFHFDFARANIFITGMILILCACDISLVQMLPWKETPFYGESKGFPSKSLMRFALVTDTIQACVSAICTIVYLTEIVQDGTKNAMTSTRAKALIQLNISINCLTIIMSIVLLFLREILLNQSADVFRRTSKRGSAIVELDGVYAKGRNDAAMGFSNPLHDNPISVSTFPTTNTDTLQLQEHIATLEYELELAKAKSHQMESSSSTSTRQLEYENERLQAENERLQSALREG